MSGDIFLGFSVAAGKNKAVVSTSNRVHISKRENQKTKAQLQKEREQEKRLMIIKRQAANVATDRFNDSPLQVGFYCIY